MGDGNGVAALFSEGVWGEEAESALLGLGKVLGFGYCTDGPAAEVAVGMPLTVEVGGEVGDATAVNGVGEA